MGEGGLVSTNNPKLKKIVESFRGGRDCWCEAGVTTVVGKDSCGQWGNYLKAMIINIFILTSDII